MSATMSSTAPSTSASSGSAHRPRAAARPAGRRPQRALSSVPFVLAVAGLLLGGLLALLMVNNSLAAGSFEQAHLKAELALLGEQEQALGQEVIRLSSPATLRASAKKLGLVPAGSTAYFDPLTGAIMGVPLPATGTAAATTTPATTTPDATATDGTATPDTTAPDGTTTPDATAPDGVAQPDGAAVPDDTAQDRAVASDGDR